MGEKEEWRLRSKCRQLTPLEADRIFFPSKGGKVKQAKEYCKDCPVIRECLQAALKGSPEGFQAGTTKEERKELKYFLSVTPIPDVEKYLPDVEINKKSAANKTSSINPKYANVLDDPLYGVHGPTPIEEYSMLSEAS